MQKLHSWPIAITKNSFIKRLLYHRYVRQLFGYIGPRFAICNIEGIKFYCDLQEGKGPGRSIIKYGIYEPYIMELFKQHINNNDVVIDVGANIGYFSLFSTRLTNNTIYAFEPEPFNFNILKNNIKINNVGNIKAEQKAISNKSGSLKLYINKFNQGDHRCYPSDDGRDAINIEAVTIDQQLINTADFNKVGLIKIDVQGFELNVLQGMEKTLVANEQAKVICEFELGLIKKAGQNPKSIVDFMTNLGFRWQLIDEREKQLKSITIDELLCLANKIQTLNLFFHR